MMLDAADTRRKLEKENREAEIAEAMFDEGQYLPSNERISTGIARQELRLYGNELIKNLESDPGGSVNLFTKMRTLLARARVTPKLMKQISNFITQMGTHVLLLFDGGRVDGGTAHSAFTHLSNLGVTIGLPKQPVPARVRNAALDVFFSPGLAPAPAPAPALALEPSPSRSVNPGRRGRTPPSTGVTRRRQRPAAAAAAAAAASASSGPSPRKTRSRAAASGKERRSSSRGRI